MDLHHIGFVVRDLDSSTTHWQRLFGMVVVTEPVVVSADRVRVCFLEYPGGRVELIQHLEGCKAADATSPSQPHHICFLCDDLDARVEAARNEGGIVVRPPVASEAFRGRRMCFVLYRDVGLIEWVER
jgi:methylmalonyl-CoA/ethylmalonyl-CoA epimerase